MKGQGTKDKHDPCAWENCDKRSVGHSKYCYRHRSEAKARWVAMIRAKSQERVEASTPVQTPEGTLYPASYIRAQAKGLAYIHKLEGHLYGVEVLAGIGARIVVKGKDKLGVEQTVTELL